MQLRDRPQETGQKIENEVGLPVLHNPTSFFHYFNLLAMQL